MLSILFPFTIIMIAAMPWVLYVIAPGFDNDPLRYDMALTMTRITFPYLLLMSVSAMLGGLLNAHDRFAPFAAAPIFFNIVLISMLLFAVPLFPSAGHAMAVGVTMAGVIQMLWLTFFVVRSRYRFAWQKPTLSPRIRRLFRLMGPGVFGAGVVQINLLVDVILASFLPVGAVSYLYYADRLHQLPMGVIVTAVGTALLPKMARSIGEKRADQAMNLFSRALEYSLLLAVPAAVALVIIPVPIVEVLFERGAFGAQETRATAMAIAAYALGLPAFTVTKVLATTCYANEDTVTPVKVGVVSALSNVILSYTFIHILAHVGIALATSMAAWIQFVLLAYLARRKYALAGDDRLRARFWRIIISALGMGMGLYAMQYMLSPWLSSSDPFVQIPVFAGLVSFGLIVYAALTLLSGAASISDIKSIIKRT
jgi:putative peptidoglycan lipid II flippase